MERINKAYPQASHSRDGIHAPSAMTGAAERRKRRARVVGIIKG
jgi:hypothetical protein